MNNLTDKQIDAAFRVSWEKSSKNTTAQEKPKGYVLGGLPGSGKSRLTAHLKEKIGKNIIVVDGDQLREFHPNIKQIRKEHGKDWVLHTQEFSGKMVEATINKAIEEKKNLIVEGTFRTSQAPIATLKNMKDNGYETGVAVLAVDKDICWQGTLDRHDQAIELGLEARATPRDHFDKVVDSISNTADEVYNSKQADTFKIYTRESLAEKEAVYDASKDKEKPSKIINEIIHANERTKTTTNTIEIYKKLPASEKKAADKQMLDKYKSLTEEQKTKLPAEAKKIGEALQTQEQQKQKHKKTDIER